MQRIGTEKITGMQKDSLTRSCSCQACWCSFFDAVAVAETQFVSSEMVGGGVNSFFVSHISLILGC